MTCDDWKLEQDAVRGRWVEIRTQKCAEEKDQGYSMCAEERDNGYSKCTEQRDEGYNQCCDWWPCSWACKAWVWVSNIVCVAWTWIKNVVCVAWTWIKNVVCVVWTWLVDKVWAAGVAVAWGACKIWETIFGKGSAPVARRLPLDLTNLPPFPETFLWGVATSAYQVEGNITENDWDVFTKSPAIKNRVRTLSSVVGRALELVPAEEAVHHGNLEVLKADLDRAKLLGMNAYRFSIEWSRIQPSFGSVDGSALQYYHDAIEEMHKRGLKPIATLNHLSLPKWVLTPPRESSILSAVGFPIAVEDDGFRKSLRGWETEETIEAFLAFVQIVVGTFMNRVDTWITLNEPVGSMIGVGYIGGVWPPGFSLDGERAKKAYFNLLKAHVKAYRLIKSLYGDRPSSVGVVHAMIFAKVTGAASAAGTGAGIGAVVGGVLGGVAGFLVGGPAGAVGVATLGAGVGAGVGAVVGAASDEHQAARNQFDYFYNYHFLDSLTKGQVDKAIHRREAKREYEDAKNFFGIPSTEEWKPQLDFIGLNYYRSVYVQYDQILALKADFSGGKFDNDLNGKDEKHNLLNDLGWEIYPEGLYLILTEGLNDRYHIPILITENGIPEHSDRNRAPFILAHLQLLRAAMRDGADVRGYIHWTLVDNWELQEGYRDESRFGLFTVEHTVNLDLTHPRHITEGAVALQYIIANNERMLRKNSTENPFIEPVERFGTITPTGGTVTPPSKTAGALWEHRGRDAESGFTLYVSKLQDGSLLGMIFYHPGFGGNLIGVAEHHRWVRLEGIQFNDNTKTLQFWHRYGTSRAMEGRRDYRATTSDGNLIEGTVTDSISGTRTWDAERIIPCGAWQSGSPPFTFCLSKMEGDCDFGSWARRTNSGRAAWQDKFFPSPLMNDPYWYAFDTTGIDMNALPVKLIPLGLFSVTALDISSVSSDVMMQGTIDFMDKGVRVQSAWEARRLPDDVPF